MNYFSLEKKITDYLKELGIGGEVSRRGGISEELTKRSNPFFSFLEYDLVLDLQGIFINLFLY